MLARIKTVVDFINVSKSAVGEAAASKIQKEQLRHLLVSLTSTNLQLDEAAAIMKYFSTDADGAVKGAFSDEDRIALASAVVAAPQGRADDAPSTKAQNQTHYYMHKYLTESDWKLIMSSSDTTAKLRTIVNRAGSIGLTHPSELSVVAMVAIITSSSRVPFGAEAVHNLVRDCKRMIKGTRLNAKQSCRTFPRMVEDYMKSFPGAYATEQPAECPLTDDQIERERGGLAARKSHRTLSQQPAGLPAAGSSLSSLVTSLASAIVGTMAHRKPEIPITILGEAGGGQGSHGGFAGSGHHVHSPFKPIAGGSPLPPVLALQDAPRSDAQASPEQSPPATRRAASLSSMDETLAALSTLFGAEKKKEGVKAAMKRPAAATAAAEDAEGDADGEPTGEPHRRPTLNVISTRNNVCVRTGVKGPGQSKCFSYSADGNQEGAKKKAKKWLIEKCQEQGIEVPDDL